MLIGLAPRSSATMLYDEGYGHYFQLKMTGLDVI